MRDPESPEALFQVAILGHCLLLCFLFTIVTSWLLRSPYLSELSHWKEKGHAQSHMESLCPPGLGVAYISLPLAGLDDTATITQAETGRSRLALCFSL